MKMIRLGLIALLTFGMLGAAWGQQYDPVGGGARMNITAGSVDCRTGLCNIYPNSTQGVVGTATNDSANAGSIGEVLQSTVAAASAVAETTATPVDVTTLALTAGDWEVMAACDRTLAGTTATIYGCALSLTANTASTQPGGSGLGLEPFITQAATFGTTVTGRFDSRISPIRVSFSATTTLHLVAVDTFSAGTVAVFGSIKARRVR